ncbi:hypothetical protein FO512_30205, partial [Bacillus cereus]|nr:hypothetical protein [Bacillus cereus]
THSLHGIVGISRIRARMLLLLSIHRVHTGLIFDANLATLHSRCILSPTDSYTYSDSVTQLVLQHNSTDIRTIALLSLP